MDGDETDVPASATPLLFCFAMKDDMQAVRYLDPMLPRVPFTVFTAIPTGRGSDTCAPPPRYLENRY